MKHDPNLEQVGANSAELTVGLVVDSELQAMLANDEHHWWYRGRRRVLRSELARLPWDPGSRALDAGCGSGRTLDELAAYASVSGVDLDPAAVAVARGRGHADVRVGAIELLPYPSEGFDLITCLDVLEHVPDDVLALRELRRVARAGAALIVTVPAHPALWSSHDERNLHYRRYTRAALHRAAAAAGWRLVRDSYFNGLLLAPAAAFRVLARLQRGERSDLERTPAVLDRLLELPLRAEAALLHRGGRMPFGLSIVAIYTAPPTRIWGAPSDGRSHGALTGVALASGGHAASEPAAGAPPRNARVRRCHRGRAGSDRSVPVPAPRR